MLYSLIIHDNSLTHHYKHTFYLTLLKHHLRLLKNIYKHFKEKYAKRHSLIYYPLYIIPPHLNVFLKTPYFEKTQMKCTK